MDSNIGTLKVEKVLNGKLLEMCYFAHNNTDNKCICIDPGYETDKIMRCIDEKGFVVDSILLTHGHFDHVLTCRALQDRFDAKIYISKIDENILYSSEHNYAFLINKTNFDNIKIYKTLEDGDVIDILGYKIYCLSTPGHTKGSICYYFKSENILFSGDTLFKDTYGRVDLFSGNLEEMKDSLYNKLFKLPDDTKVYPGHGMMTDIAHEKIYNEINRSDYI